MAAGIKTSQGAGLVVGLVLILGLLGGFFIDAIGLNLEAIQSLKGRQGVVNNPETDRRLTVWGDCRQAQLVGRDYLFGGDVELALDSLEAGTLCGDDPWAWFYLGQAQYALGDLDGAAESWRHTPEGYHQAVVLAQTAVESGDEEEAVAAWNFALTVKPDEQGPYIQLARLAVDSGPETVEELLRQAIEANPNAPAAYIELGDVLAAAGDRVEAQHLYERALTLDPSNVSLLVTLAENAAVLEDTPAAIDYWQAVALRNERRQGLAYYQIGNLAFGDGNFSSALAFFKRAVEIEPGNGRFLLGLAGAYAEVGCRQEAIGAYQDVLETAAGAGVLEEAQLKLAELAVLNNELSPCLDVS